ncbi:hypothetical protein JKL49_03420 [Phenylobacterium sp. 20VBR1]|uniref:Metal-dependent hydrolase n=1 Tax=Phenylobacterium glaciei TaxID=2803784 RepID=A0A941D172_9CAUL|nr:metal-dependent hydrolase [Phenylobacterium glaciei]MBR7618428.1 hypothetical protein [Phenylobacterium glaciei]
MFVGHYAAALAAKSAEPRGPLWTYVLGCQLIDVAWGGLIMTGAERLTVDPSLPGSALVLEHMPYTHSLPGALAWAVGAAILAKLILRLPWRVAAMIGLTVFSHWIADLLVHRPDLELWFGGQKVGLGLWNYPVAEQAVEIGLVALAASAWAWRRATLNQSLWPVLAFVSFLLALQIVGLLVPATADPVGMGGMAIAAYLVATALAALLDRRRAA